MGRNSFSGNARAHLPNQAVASEPHPAGDKANSTIAAAIAWGSRTCAPCACPGISTNDGVEHVPLAWLSVRFVCQPRSREAGAREVEAAVFQVRNRRDRVEHPQDDVQIGDPPTNLDQHVEQ